MDIDIIFRIAGVGIIVAVINQVLKQAGKEEISMLTTLTGVIIVLFMVVDLINQLFQNIRQIFNFY
jgi:stage III sporulation protein AC